MAKQTFNPADEAAGTGQAPSSVDPTTTTAAPSTAVVVREDRAPAVYVNTEEAQGEFDNEDCEKLYLTIVAKTGKLSNEFTSGDLLLNKEFVIGDTKNPVVVIPMGIRKLYQNDLDFESNDDMGDTVSTAVEVINRGGVVGYRPYDDKVSKHFWKKIMNIPLLVQQPAMISPEAAANFLYEIEGKAYAVVGYTARTKTAYNGIAKPLSNALKKLGSVRSKTYRLSVAGEDFDGKSWMQPSLRVVGETSPAIVEFIKNYRF